MNKLCSHWNGGIVGTILLLGSAWLAADDRGVGPVGADPVRLSLEEAVVTALENNRSLQARRLEPLIAGTFEERERAVFDPFVFGEVGYSRERTEQVSRATGQRFSVEGEDARGELGLGVRLPTGTDLELGLNHIQTESDRTPEQQAVRVGVSVTQALLRGRGREANLVGIRQARLDTMASESELRGFTEALVAEVEEAYWDLLLAQREEVIFEESVVLARSQRQAAEERIEVGQIPATERAAVAAEVALRQQALINARNRRQRFQLQLFSLLTPGSSLAGWESELELADLPTLPDWDLGNLPDRLVLAQRERPELEESRLQLQRQELEVIRTRNGLLPRLDLFVNLGKSGFANSFGGAYRDLDGEGYDAGLGLRFEHALGNRAGRSNDRRARFVRQQAEEALRNLEHLVELDVRQAWLEVDRSRQQVEASAATRRLQEEALRAEQEKFQVGRSTVLQVAQIQRDLLASQVAEIEALIDVRKALVRLYRMEGTLLRRRGLDLG
jgi:outer membrane protein